MLSLIVSMTAPVLIATAAHAVTENAPAVKQIRVVLPWGSDQLNRISSVVARQVETRSAATVTSEGKAPLTVALSIDPPIGKEGFRISDRADGAIEVTGQNELGVLYGLGKLLRSSQCSEKGFAPK